MAPRAVVLAGLAVHAAVAQFAHPGILVDQPQLDFIRSRVAAQAEPMYSAFVKATNSPAGALSYAIQGPPATGVVECGPYSQPDIGCKEEAAESSAAFLQAILWTITGNRQYATNAMAIMDAWSAGLKDHTNSNAPLQAAWSAAKWARAAEVITYSNAGWSDASRARFSTMLTQVYLPKFYAGSTTNGNWELTMIDAMMGIGVFTNDQSLFYRAVTFWRQRIPAYFYYHTDGSQPVPAPRGTPSWYGQTVFDQSVDGICQETCRDLGHTTMGFGSAIYVAETALIQGVNLYGEEQARITAAMEFHSNLLLGAPVPSSVCGGKVVITQAPTWEVAYNHYHNRLGLSLPRTIENIIKNVRTRPNIMDQEIVVYETLTHAGLVSLAAANASAAALLI